MDMLKRTLAPLTQEAWNEIEEKAAEVIKTHLSARQVVKVDGPKGWNYNAVPKGRLELIEEKDGEVCSGLNSVQPLVETRITFELDRWEMDNIIRGAKDADLAPLEAAAEKIALFEENAIYNGYIAGNIKGLVESAGHKFEFGSDANAIMSSLSKGLLKLKHSYAEGPYTLVVGKASYEKINMVVNGYPLKKAIEEFLGTEIVYAPALEGALMVPYDHDDLEFTIGQDFSIGYQSHDSSKVKLFITESFTFRVLNPDIIILFTL
ncbi:bacteriocin family protein [Alkaliphilus pronyensis]|uniref:Type 1 encapsulin shell protein n=1 Tax=Alkaliphilus pronyensis TaxID=1482732 RepID=A0A6I0F5X5_9FIRM|nr:family 1 encapsulin nanocompartment shell protein [Alkaliphilus pronyensis]KAB3530331.1 bacteriocin family protein [Alkaliphilus pronyensis]